METIHIILVALISFWIGVIFMYLLLDAWFIQPLMKASKEARDGWKEALALCTKMLAEKMRVNGYDVPEETA